MGESGSQVAPGHPGKEDESFRVFRRGANGGVDRVVRGVQIDGVGVSRGRPRDHDGGVLVKVAGVRLVDQLDPEELGTTGEARSDEGPHFPPGVEEGILVVVQCLEGAGSRSGLVVRRPIVLGTVRPGGEGVVAGALGFVVRSGERAFQGEREIAFVGMEVGLVVPDRPRRDPFSAELLGEDVLREGGREGGSEGERVEGRGGLGV